jgi:hypothetical protein
MKMKGLRLLLCAVAAAVLLVSCQGNGRQPNVSGEITLEGLSADKWTYFSFETGAAVGTSDYRDEAQDAAWAERSDWDFAICGDYIKTNSGTSGKGAGGVQQNKTDAFLQITEAPESGYLVDTLRIAR